MNRDLRHFPSVVREYRQDTKSMSRIGISLAITAIVMLVVTVHRAAFTEEKVIERVKDDLASHQAKLIASCMNGKMWVYTDPHTGNTMGVFCDIHTLSRKM